MQDLNVLLLSRRTLSGARLLIHTSFSYRDVPRCLTSRPALTPGFELGKSRRHRSLPSWMCVACSPFQHALSTQAGSGGILRSESEQDSSQHSQGGNV